jgi:hypothetical protein
MKVDWRRYWQSRLAHERMEKIFEMGLAAYAMKGFSFQGKMHCGATEQAA